MVDYTTKEVYTGPGWVRLVGDLARLPMLNKTGAIRPSRRISKGLTRTGWPPAASTSRIAAHAPGGLPW